MLFIQYPKCTTCQKAKKFLDENKIKYIDRNIVTDNPTKEDLEKFIKIGNLDIKKLFNTSGMKYRELGLKDKLKTMSDDEKLELLATDGMLVKRPLLVGEDFVLTGFKQEQWTDTLN
ncbi:arsenate reductase family protein [Peptoanaerobacter stomatis]|jgi:transcriptional regulator, spx/mgsR family